MKKIVLATLLASGLMAADNGFYVGANVGAMNAKADSTWSWTNTTLNASDSGSDSSNSNATAIELKVGYYFNGNNRINVAVDKAKFDGVDSFSSTVGYDYLYGTSVLKPFIGVFGNFSQFKPDGGSSFNGAYAGGQIGINYAVNEHVSVEIGGQYMVGSAKYSETIVSGTDTNSQSVDIKSKSNFFIGANYKF